MKVMWPLKVPEEYIGGEGRRYDYYAGEGFGIHARLGTVTTQEWRVAININMTLLRPAGQVG